MFHTKLSAIAVFGAMLSPSLHVYAAEPLTHQPKIDRPAHADVSPPLRDIQIVNPIALNANRPRPRIPQAPVPNNGPDPVLQSYIGGSAGGSVGPMFDGVGANGSAPPDANIAVGPNHVVQWVNAQYAVYSKAGAVLLGPTPGNAIWAGFGGPCETTNDGDPIVQYDRAADRWVMSQLANTSGPTYYQCFAVSTTNDPTGAYYRYAYTFSSLNDYPKLGVWSNAYFASYNMFRPIGGSYSFQGSQACAYDRAAMLAGNASAAGICFQLSRSYGGLLPSDLDGAAAPPGPGYYVNFGTNSLNIWKFTPDFQTPSASTFTGPVNLPAGAFNTACSGGGTCIPQSGTAQQLDSLGDRLMYRLAYRNFGSYESLVVNHSVAAGTAVGVRWYEIRNPNGTPAVYQQGTYAPADSTYRWMGSIAMDQAGNIALGYSASSSSIHPQIRYTGRLAGDPLGTMSVAEQTILAGSGSQTANLSRWGDYSAMRIDPSDDCTFWFTTEYIPGNGTFNWKTAIASFKLSSCGGTQTVPQTPTGLTATGGDQKVSLAWTGSSGATSYTVYRGTASGTYTTSFSNVTGTTFVDTSVANGAAYYYVVEAVNSVGSSGYSNEASATPQAAPAPTVPAAPAGLSASGARKKVNLSWTQSATAGVSQNRIYRGTTPGTYVLLTTIPAGTSYTDNTVTSRTTYYYVVTAVSSGGESPYSNQAAATSR